MKDNTIVNITGINYPIEMRYVLDGGRWRGPCPRCPNRGWVQWFQTDLIPIRLGWRYWKAGTCGKFGDIE